MHLHFKRQGQDQNPPIILLHGLFGSADNWGMIAKQLAQHYQVISVDLRNHGRSPHSESQSYADMANDVLVVCDTLGIDKAHVLGHSLGGKVAMQFATTHPERMEKLIVVDMATRAYPDEHTHLIDAMLNVDLSTMASRSAVDKALRSAIPNTMVRQFLLMNLVKVGAGLQWRINLPALKTNYPAFIQANSIADQYDKPSLFIRGERSHYISESDIEALKAQFTRASFSRLPTEHWVHAEQPDTFSEIVNNFLAGE